MATRASQCSGVLGWLLMATSLVLLATYQVLAAPDTALDTKLSNPDSLLNEVVVPRRRLLEAAVTSIDPNMTTSAGTNVTQSPTSGTSAGNQSTEITTPEVTSPKVTTAEVSCDKKPYRLDTVCPLGNRIATIFGADLTLEGVGAMLFNPDILEDLGSTCRNGSWCLGTRHDRYMFQSVSGSFYELCPLTACMLDIPDHCLDQERRLTLSTLILLCELRNYANATSQHASCGQAVSKMAHVAMTTLQRDMQGLPLEGCAVADKDSCSGLCTELAQQLNCMCEECSHPYELFKQYASWQWFFNMDNSDVTCRLNQSDCSMFSRRNEHFYQEWWYRLRMLDAKVVTGVICACVITMTGIIATLIACVRRPPGYSRNTIEYNKVKGADDADGDDDPEDEIVDISEFLPA